MPCVHGQANHIVISLSQQHGQLTLEVSDNGIGFDPYQSRQLGPESGLGLRIMAYRAGVIGGVLHIERKEEGGMVVSCKVLQNSIHSLIT